MRRTPDEDFLNGEDTSPAPQIVVVPQVQAMGGNGVLGLPPWLLLAALAGIYIIFKPSKRRA